MQTVCELPHPVAPGPECVGCEGQGVYVGGPQPHGAKGEPPASWVLGTRGVCLCFRFYLKNQYSYNLVFMLSEMFKVLCWNDENCYG